MPLIILIAAIQTSISITPAISKPNLKIFEDMKQVAGWVCLMKKAKGRIYRPLKATNAITLTLKT